MYIYIYIYIYKYNHICMYIYIYTCKCVRIFVYVCACVYINIYIHWYTRGSNLFSTYFNAEICFRNPHRKKPKMTKYRGGHGERRGSMWGGTERGCHEKKFSHPFGHMTSCVFFCWDIQKWYMSDCMFVSSTSARFSFLILALSLHTNARNRSQTFLCSFEHARTHALTHKHTHERTYARTHKHTHTHSLSLSFSLSLSLSHT